MSKPASIGIIGGADGPTVIFTTGNPKGAIAVAAAVVVLIIGAILCIRNYKNR